MSLVLRVENAPDALTDEPIGVLLIDPPVSSTLLLAKVVLALTDPTRFIVSKTDPIFTVSANVSSVAIFTILPAVPVAIFIVLELFPVPKLTVPVVPESSVRSFAPVVKIEPAPAKVRSVAVTPIVSSEITPDRAPRVVTFNPPFDVRANVPVALPIVIFPVPVVAIFTSEAPNVPRFVVPDDERVVNAPVDGVVAPIAVLFIPVAVVLKLPDVIRILFDPKSMDEADNPDSDNAPEVAVKLRAPVVKVNPFEAVSKAFEVIVPEPVVDMFPEVVRFPFSSIVKVAEPEDWITKAVLRFSLLSFMIRAEAVP